MRRISGPSWAWDERIARHCTLRRTSVEACERVGVKMSLYAGTKHTFATDSRLCARRGARTGRGARKRLKIPYKVGGLVVEAAGIEPESNRRKSLKRKKSAD